MATLSQTIGLRRHGMLRAGVLLTLLAPTPRLAAAPPIAALKEYELKAAAVYNIILFTEWPASAFASATGPLIVAIVGRGPVADVLDGLVQTTAWRGHPVSVQRFSSVAEIKHCHVVYLALSEHAGWERLRRFGRSPVLTLCSGSGFAGYGGCVELAMDRNRLRLIINVAALKNAGLAVSSQVLRLAEVVGD